MTSVVKPVDPELFRDGVCWSCKQPFSDDGFYIELGMGTAAHPAWSTCLGCAAILYCSA